MNMEELSNIEEDLKRIGKIIRSIEDLDLVITNNRSDLDMILTRNLGTLIDTYHNNKNKNEPFSKHFVNDFMNAYRECITSGIMRQGDGVLLKFNELQENHITLQKQSDEKDLVIKELEKDRDFYKRKKEAYEARYPKLRDIDTLEGDVNG